MKTLIIFFFLLCSAEAAQLKYGTTVSLLRDSHEHISKHSAPDYWALSPHYVPQITGSSCSSASVVMVLNGLRESAKLLAADPLITQKNVHETVKNKEWQNAVDERGGGRSLDQLQTVVKEALTKYGFKIFEVTALHVDSTSTEMKKKIHDLLVLNEKSSNDFIIANFLQSEFTGDPEGNVGHLAPVAAYDAKRKKVLLMDPDREWYEPYWVTEETFLKGLNTKDSDGKSFRGLLHIKVGGK